VDIVLGEDGKPRIALSSVFGPPIVIEDCRETSLLDIIAESKWAKSRREARELIKNNAIRVNSAVIGGAIQVLEESDFLPFGTAVLLRSKGANALQILCKKCAGTA